MYSSCCCFSKVTKNHSFMAMPKRVYQSWKANNVSHIYLALDYAHLNISIYFFIYFSAFFLFILVELMVSFEVYWQLGVLIVLKLDGFVLLYWNLMWGLLFHLACIEGKKVKALVFLECWRWFFLFCWILCLEFQVWVIHILEFVVK